LPQVWDPLLSLLPSWTSDEMNQSDDSTTYYYKDWLGISIWWVTVKLYFTLR
jgi:hypothetical protein